jgi:cytochrome c biogenesis protein CcmG, thiol:disulfide interchange protein DsbE
MIHRKHPDPCRLLDAGVVRPAGTAPPGKKRRRVMIVGAAILLVVAGCGVFAALSTSSNSTGDPLVDVTNQPATSFSLPDLLTPARTVSLADFHGKALVVNFWASWCFPCQAEMPVLESAYRSEHGQVQFLGIDTNDSRGAALQFLGRLHVTYPSLSLPDPRDEMVSAYGLVGLPITVFISASGRMVGTHIGQLDAATLRAALREAFAGRGSQ